MSAFLLAPPLQADVFESFAADGTPIYSNQPKHAQSRLVVRDTPARDVTERSRIKALARQLAETHQVDAALVLAVIAVESGFDPSATSPAGAMGLMQLMPATARHYGVTDPYDERQNLAAGIRYLRDLTDLHGGNVTLALSAYNSGARTVERYGSRIPPYRETMLYVARVLARVRRFNDELLP